MTAIANLIFEIIKTLKDWGVFAVRPGLYRRFFERSNAFFMIANDKGFILEINEAFAERLGFKRETLRGTKFMKHVHPDDQQKTILEMEKIRAGADVAGFRNRYICSNEEVITLEWLSTGNGTIYAVAREIES